MYTKLSNAKLKTGEDIEIGLVLAPDQEHSDAIAKVLHHKGEPWLSHVSRALSGDIKGLETRFYVGKLDNQVVANVMTVEYRHTGILGHVFTIPEQRRKHICSLIMEQLMSDFRYRGGGVLLLGTGYNSAPYWIYHSYGFRSVLENTGFMRYSTDDDFEAKHFTPTKDSKAVDVQWKHWPVMSVLTSVHETELMKSVASGLYGVLSFEGGFLHFIKRIEDGNLKAKLLESESGAVVGVKEDRPGWHQLMDYLRAGDSLVITELSRMTRSLKHLLQVVEDLEHKGVSIISLREHIDTSTATGRCFVSIMGAISQMERELKNERTAAGRKAAKARGRTGGRPRTDQKKLEQARILYENSNQTASEACQAIGIGRRTLFNYIAQRRENIERIS